MKLQNNFPALFARKQVVEEREIKPAIMAYELSKLAGHAIAEGRCRKLIRDNGLDRYEAHFTALLIEWLGTNVTDFFYIDSQNGATMENDR